jgi:hypothetical protein
MTVQQIAEKTFSAQQLKNEDVLIFIDKMNTLIVSLERRSFLAVEFGYKFCEKGENLQMTLGEYKKLWHEV